MTTGTTGRGERRSAGLHLVCERDVGLFSLIQQVIAHIPWAEAARRTPIVLFEGRCCYWVPAGYRGRSSVWEYYFEPLDPDHPASAVSPETRAALARDFPDWREAGVRLDDGSFASSHFGDHPRLAGRTLSIPHEWCDPDPDLRAHAGRLIRRHVRPRSYIAARVDAFADAHMAGRRVLGVHIRGTDAVSSAEDRAHRRGSLVLERYRKAVERWLQSVRDGHILVATDDQRSLDFMIDAFGERVHSFATHRHRDGEVVGHGPTGALMPSYVARDPETAARNGEDAVIEHLLLARCAGLVHNGSSLARTVLLQNPSLPHVNTHRKSRIMAHVETFSMSKLRRTVRRTLRRAHAVHRGDSADA